MQSKRDKKQVFDEKKEGIVRHSIYISVIVCIGKLLGFVKQSVVAWAFGAGSVTDTYYAADGYTSMIGQVMGQSVGPTVLTRYIDTCEKEGNEEGQSLLYECLTFFSLLGLVLALGSICLSSLITRIIGISFESEQCKELQNILMALCPVMVITPISGVCSAYLDASRKFVPSKLCSIFFSISITVSLLLFRTYLGIWALVVGFITGYILHMVLMLICVGGSIKICFKNPFRDPKFRHVLKTFGPMVLGNSVVDFGHLVDRIVASSLVTGSVSVLFYGQVVSGDIVNAVVITTIGTVLLTSFSQKITRNIDLKVLSNELREILCSLALLTCMITSLYWVVGQDLIKLFFERGSFDAESTEKVLSVACAYSIGFVFMAFREVLIKVHYAFLDTFSPMINSVIGVVVNLFASIVFSRMFGVWGIAAATSISMLLVSILSFFTLKKHMKDSLVNTDFLLDILKILISTIISIVIGIKSIVILENTFMVFRMCIGALWVICIFGVMCMLFREKIVIKYFQKIKARVAQKN